MKEHFRSRHRRAISAVLGVVAVLFVTSCAPEVDTDAVSKELARLDDEWSKAASTKNADAVGAYYAEDAIAYPPGEPATVGRVAATKVWATYFADSTFSISWKTDRAGVAQSGELGYTSGTYEDTYMGADSAMVMEKGKYLCVWAKQADGSWKAVHDMWNTDSK